MAVSSAVLWQAVCDIKKADMFLLKEMPVEEATEMFPTLIHVNLCLNIKFDWVIDMQVQ